MTSRRPRGFWRDVILEGYAALGGAADNADLYAWIENNINLTPHKLAASRHGGRPYYRHTVRGIASDMKDDGLLIHVGWGRYRLP